MNVEPEFTLKSSFFFLSFFSPTVEWKLHLAPDRNESHCMSFPVLFFFDISLIHRILSCVTKYPQCGKICPSCYGWKSNRVGGFQGFAEAVLQKRDVILWYEARLNLNADWLLSHYTTGPVCVWEFRKNAVHFDKLFYYWIVFISFIYFFGNEVKSQPV